MVRQGEPALECACRDAAMEIGHILAVGFGITLDKQCVVFLGNFQIAGAEPGDGHGHAIVVVAQLFDQQAGNFAVRIR